MGWPMAVRRAMTSKLQRPRFAGDLQHIVDVMRPFAEKNISFVKYCDNNDDMHAVEILQHALLDHAEFLVAMQALFPSMAYTRKQIQHSLLELGASMNKKWKLDQPQLTDWHNTMQIRVRAIVAAYKSGLNKKKQPAWVAQIQGKGKEPSARRISAKAPAKQAQAPAKQDQAHVWSSEHRMAYKASPGAERTWSQTITPAADAKPDDQLVATWADGDRWPVVNAEGQALTVSEFTKTGRKRSSEGNPKFCIMAHSATHNEIYMQQRVDKDTVGILMSIFDNGRQVAQVRLSCFGHLELPIHNVLPEQHELVNKRLLDSLHHTCRSMSPTRSIRQRSKRQCMKAYESRDWSISGP